jgi:hypothetical protein
MTSKFHRLGNKILDLYHIESLEPFDEYNSPDIRIMMSSSKKHYITYESREKRDEAFEDLWKLLSSLNDR